MRLRNLCRILKYAITEGLLRQLKDALRKIKSRKTIPFSRVSNRAKKIAVKTTKASTKIDQPCDPLKNKSLQKEQGWDDTTTVV